MVVAPARKAKRLTRTVVERRLLEAYVELFDELFRMTEATAAQIVNAMFAVPQDGEVGDSDSTKGAIATVRLMFGRRGRVALKKDAANIKTEAELEKRIAEIHNASYELPSGVRKVLKGFAAQLPRRGGPGRTPKLNAAEEQKACDQIALAIRRGAGVKQALKETAEKIAALLGKRVSARTLQKAWNRRKTPIDT